MKHISHEWHQVILMQKPLLYHSIDAAVNLWHRDFHTGCPLFIKVKTLIDAKKSLFQERLCRRNCNRFNITVLSGYFKWPKELINDNIEHNVGTVTQRHYNSCKIFHFFISYIPLCKSCCLKHIYQLKQILRIKNHTEKHQKLLTRWLFGWNFDVKGGNVTEKVIGKAYLHQHYKWWDFGSAESRNDSGLQ